MKQNRTLSISLPVPLGLIFITLKLTNVITWPWLWVLSPFWLPLAVVLGILAGVGVFFVLTLLVGAILNR